MPLASTLVKKPRKPWLALLLSLVLPGYGQLYNGEPNKAVWLFLCLVLLPLVVLPGIVLIFPGNWVLPACLAVVALVVSGWLYGMVDAFWVARRLTLYEPLGWQRSGLYSLVFLAVGVTVTALNAYVSRYWVAMFRVPLASMEPTVLVGDMLFVDKRYNCPHCAGTVQRGDIAVFIQPNHREFYFIKRVIGLPGERLQIRGRDIFINGKSLKAGETTLGTGISVTETDGQRTWQVIWRDAVATLPQTELTIPNGQVFMLGDNRSASNDSRFFGTVPLQDVVGKARQVWLSLDNHAQRVRWSRSGQLLQ